MTRTASPSFGLAALLAVALLVLAAGPAAATVVAAFGTDCCHESCPPPEAPDSGPTCCAQAPAASHSEARALVPPATDVAHVARLVGTVRPLAVPSPHAPPRDTGPPPGPRRHLALSVFLV